MYHLLSSWLNKFEGKPVNGCTIIGWVHEASTAVKAANGDVSLIFSVTDDSLERQLPTEQRRYFCKVVLYLVKNSNAPTLHLGDVVLINNVMMKKDTNPKGTADAASSCFMGTKGKWSMHILPYAAFATHAPSTHAIQCFGKRNKLPDQGGKAMQLLAQSVTEVAASASRTLHHHAPTAQPHPSTHPADVAQVLTGQVYFHPVTGAPMPANGASPIHSLAATAAHKIAAECATAAAHGEHTDPAARQAPPPPPPPPPPESEDDGSGARATSAVHTAGACTQDGCGDASAAAPAATAEAAQAAHDRRGQRPATQRPREDTPEPSPRAIPFAQSGIASADGTPAANENPAAQPAPALDDAEPPPPVPDLPDSGPAAELQQQPPSSAGVAKQPLGSIANRMVSILAASVHGNLAEKPPERCSAGAHPPQPVAAAKLTPVDGAAPASPRSPGDGTGAAGTGPVASPPCNQGTPSQPQWKLSSSPRQRRFGGASVQGQAAELQQRPGLELRPPPLPTCASSPSVAAEHSPPSMLPTALSGNSVRPSEVQLPDAEPTELQLPDVEPTERQALAQQSDVQANERQVDEIQATELQVDEIQATELQPTELQPTELQVDDLQATELQPTELQSSEVQTTDSPEAEQPMAVQLPAWPRAAVQATETQPVVPPSAPQQKPVARPTELQQTDSQDTELQHVALQPTEIQQADSQPMPARADAQHARMQSSDEQPAADQAGVPPRTSISAEASPARRVLPASLQASRKPAAPAPGDCQPDAAAAGVHAEAPRRPQTCDRAVQTSPPPGPRRAVLSAAALAPPSAPASVSLPARRRRRASAPACDAPPAKRQTPARRNAPHTAPRAPTRHSPLAAHAGPSPRALPPLPSLSCALRQALRAGPQAGGVSPACGRSGTAAQDVRPVRNPRSKAALMAARGPVDSPPPARQVHPPLWSWASHAAGAGGGRLRALAAESGRHVSAPAGARRGLDAPPGQSFAAAGGPRLACFPGRDMSVMVVRAALLRGERPPPPSVS